jgi:hypothetical protein
VRKEEMVRMDPMYLYPSLVSCGAVAGGSPPMIVLRTIDAPSVAARAHEPPPASQTSGSRGAIAGIMDSMHLLSHSDGRYSSPLAGAGPAKENDGGVKGCSCVCVYSRLVR